MEEVLVGGVWAKILRKGGGHGVPMVIETNTSISTIDSSPIKLQVEAHL